MFCMILRWNMQTLTATLNGARLHELSDLTPKQIKLGYLYVW